MQSAIIAETDPLPNNQWQLYVLRTAAGNLYTGISTDPQRRLRQHQGELTGGSRALRGKGPLQLVWLFPAHNRSHASVLEYQLKQLKKSDKERLVNGSWQPEWLQPTPEPATTVTATTIASTEVA
ncbi:MAG: GIY-YIG nuclease family protein [Chromatiaceae bacterium]